MAILTSIHPADGFVFALALKPGGKILVGGVFSSLGGQTRNYLGQLNPNGSLDAAFNPGANDWVNALAVQSDGKILVGGFFTTLGGSLRNHIGRINPDGTLDTAFNPLATDDVFSLTVQSDGKILLRGNFTSLGGQSRSHLGRLSADTTIQQNPALRYDGSQITWERSGAGPETQRVTFEWSADGYTYTLLGLGTRISGGWRLTGLNLPRSQNFWIRARGYFSSGYFNASGSVVESVRNFYLNGFIFLTLVVN